MGKIYEAIMRNVKSEAYEADAPKLGRRTIDDGWLSANRDALVNILSWRWTDIGWQLTTATTREELRQALQAVKDHPDRHLIARLLRPTKNTTTSAGQIRKKRLAHGEAVKCMNDAQTNCNKCMNGCREVEVAMSQAKPEQIDFIQREFLNRRAECQEAQNQLRAAKAAESMLEEELLNEEAAFAQDELLTFIKKGKYALHPLNLANAMAGLPYATSVPFVGVWQSHARCSKLECSGWPSYGYQVFKTIDSIWKDSERSSISRLELFQEEIKALPKTVRTRIPGETKFQKADNYVRTYLSENWWYLQHAIEKSVQITDDPRPMPFIICSTFNELLGSARTAADLVMAEAARIR